MSNDILHKSLKHCFQINTTRMKNRATTESSSKEIPVVAKIFTIFFFIFLYLLPMHFLLHLNNCD